MRRNEADELEPEKQIDKLIYCQHASQQQVYKRQQTLTLPITKTRPENLCVKLPFFVFVKRARRETYEITRGYSFVIFSSVFNEVCLKCDILVPHKIRCWLHWAQLEKNSTIPSHWKQWELKKSAKSRWKSQSWISMNHKTVYFASRDLTLHKNFSSGCNETD